MTEIRTLSDLIASGFDEDALENDRYLYIWPYSPDKDSADSHLYRYNKEDKKLERIPGFISIIAEIDDAKDVKINTGYLEQLL